MNETMNGLAAWAAPLWERLVDKWPEILEATWETVDMVLLSTLFSMILGFLLAILMIVTNPIGLRPCRSVYQVVDFVVNLLRSFPFIILLIAIIPFTRMLVGTTIGSAAAIVPLTVAAAPFVARLIETCFLEVDRGVIEAARSFGAGDMQIIFRVLIPEALPSIVLNVAVVAITLLGYSAMAGTVGGGGLGDLAVKYGYNRFQPDIMVYSVIILCVLVLVIQGICNFLYKILR
ncbi:MAG: ABC transporter permease [Desulfovibrio desulfuricans]|jgi:D-methionine transport system permease protein|uniref:methionine ABC transporter permease n=1 Tax=uncultured Desulfovibrio sp. TaxID=167968 RepID=UPI002608FEBA|nr:methionine ABC transporter permease [uncultured Desulfovibrio sp.]MBE6442779.1 ABC transporter permease [Desulfovibrio desulfuricans]